MPVQSQTMRAPRKRTLSAGSLPPMSQPNLGLFVLVIWAVFTGFLFGAASSTMSPDMIRSYQQQASNAVPLASQTFSPGAMQSAMAVVVSEQYGQTSAIVRQPNSGSTGSNTSRNSGGAANKAFGKRPGKPERPAVRPHPHILFVSCLVDRRTVWLDGIWLC